MDGGKAAENAVVYVLRDELVRFTKWISGAAADTQIAVKRNNAGIKTADDIW
jgi:hypothetical protein